MKKSYRILSLFLVLIVCTVMTVQTIQARSGGGGNWEEDGETPLESLNQLNPSDLSKSMYNDTITPLNFTVEEKIITGNTKHFLQWKNPNGYENYKVEVYAQPYLNYVDTKDFNMTPEELAVATWKEAPLPPIKCCTTDATDVSSVINFSDIWNTLETIPDADFKHFNETAAESSLLDLVFSLIPMVGNSNALEAETTLTAKTRYLLNDSITANYIKYSRVKYYIRYVNLQSGVVKPDSKGNYNYYITARFDNARKPARTLTFKSTVPLAIEAYEIIWKKNDGIYDWWFLYNLFEYDSDKENLQTSVKKEPIYFSVPGVPANPTTVDNWREEWEKIRNGDVLDFLWTFMSNIPCVSSKSGGVMPYFLGFKEHGTASLAPSNLSLYGKFIENDSTVTGGDGMEVPPPDNPDGTKPTPRPTVKPDTGTDTGEADNSTDVIHWLKKIYARLGAILGLMVVGDVIFLVKDFFDNSMDDLETGMEGVSKVALTKFPFSVIATVGVVLGAFAAEPVTPVYKFKVGFKSISLLGQTYKGFQKEVVLDLSMFNTWAEIIRAMLVVLFIFNLGSYTFSVSMLLKGGKLTE